MDEETRQKRIYCMHHNHRWQVLNEKKHEMYCSHCGLSRDEHQEDIYHIPHLVRREVGYADKKTYF